MANIVYMYYDNVYLNITNKCNCNCTFCIRSKSDAIGDAKNMWFDEEPTIEEIKQAIDDFDFTSVKKAVFCGYGEPTCELEKLLEAASYLKQINADINLRLNTNGLANLYHGRSVAKEICSVFDSISVSLNEPSSEKYDKITRNPYGGKAFLALLSFTKECVLYCDDVRMTVVDVISQHDIEKSKQICEETGARFKVRSFSKGR